MARIDAHGNGLRPHAKLSRDNRFLREQLNQMPLGPRGERPVPSVTYPVSSPALGISFPNPMMIKDEKTLVRLGSSTFHDVSMTDFTATTRSAYGSTQNVRNRRFITDTLWTKGTGWAITGGAATATTASSNLTQPDANLAVAFVNSAVYLVTFTMTRSAGTLTPFIGTQAGTTRSTSGTYTEEITAPSSGADFILTGSGFTGTVDNVSIVRLFAINSSGPWQMVAFQDKALFASSNDQFLYRIPDNPVGTGGEVTLARGVNLSVDAVGKHNGAVVLGGLSGTQTQNALFVDLFTHWKRVQRQRQITAYGEAFDASYIMYGMDGDYDSPFYLLMAALAIPGDDEATILRGVLRRAVERGWIGFYRPRFAGSVRALRQLGNDLMVYGANGIARLTRGETGYSEQHLMDQGIAGRGCVNGDEREHIFLTGGKRLYRDTGNGPIMLGARDGDPLGGYEEYMANLTVANAVVSFDPQERMYWISDGSRCYLWTGYGLGESDVVQPSSVFRLSLADTLYGTAVTKSNPQASRSVTTIISDPERRVIEVSSVNVSSQEGDATSIKATVDWRMRSSDAFKRPALIDVPDGGCTFTKKSGVDVRVVTSCDDYRDSAISHVDYSVNTGSPAIANIFAGADTVLSETNP